MKRQSPKHCRRIASNELVTPEGQCLTHYVIELSQEATVTCLYPLVQETAFTEWMPGRIVLRNDDGLLHAYYKNKMIGYE